MHEAREVMTSNVYTVFPDTPLIDAARLFVEKRITGLPVVDEGKKLVGIISEKDLLRLLVDTDPVGKTVEEFMTREVITFKVADSLVSICEFLMRHNIRRVPIVDDGVLVGIVSRGDIMSEILRNWDDSQKK